MDITRKCFVSGTHGFDLNEKNRFAILEVEAKNGDIIKVNKIDGIQYNDLSWACEYPKHEEHPIIDNQNKIIVIGGEEKKSKRTITIIGK